MARLKKLKSEAVVKASLNRAIKSYILDPKLSELPMSRLKFC